MDPSNRERMEKRIRDQLNRHQYSSTKPKTQSLESPEFEDLIGMPLLAMLTQYVFFCVD
jgi:hypothetical protein